jgi:hypothetical protein
MHPGHPSVSPVEIFVAVALVVVDVVFVSDIEGRIGEDQIDAARGDLVEQLDAIALVDFVGCQSHGCGSEMLDRFVTVLPPLIHDFPGSRKPPDRRPGKEKERKIVELAYVVANHRSAGTGPAGA